MKNLLLIIFMLTTDTSFASNYSGNWRGLLQLSTQGSFVLGIQIKQSNKGLTVVLDSPNQAMHDYRTTTANINGNILTLSAKKLNVTFEGEFKGDKLIGVFKQNRDIPVTLTRLSEKQSKKLLNERTWYGHLPLSKNNKLPVELHVAVGPGGYHVTLDSPKQKSIGIPVNEFSLQEKTLTFASKMINASYEGKWIDNAWHGTFVQGSAKPLVLKKSQ